MYFDQDGYVGEESPSSTVGQYVLAVFLIICMVVGMLVVVIGIPYLLVLAFL
jgi:hypothetical protein